MSEESLEPSTPAAPYGAAAAPPREAPAASPDGPRPAWPVWLAVGIAAVVLLGCLAATAVGLLVWRDTTDELTITGDLTLSGAGNGKDGTDCFGIDAYGDINQGTQIVITDPDGTTIAVGKLSSGSVKGQDCVFPFTVKHVPRPQKFYGVTISQRGTLSYTAKELKDPLHLFL